MGTIAKSLPVLHANAMPLSIRWARRSLQDGDLSAPAPLDDIVIEGRGLASGLRLPETRRLDLRQRLQLSTRLALAGQPSEQSAAADSEEGRHREGDWLAYFSAHL